MTTYKVVQAADDGYWKVEGLPHHLNEAFGDHIQYMEQGWDHKDLVESICNLHRKVKPGDIFDTPMGMFEFTPPIVTAYVPPAAAPAPAQPQPGSACSCAQPCNNPSTCACNQPAQPSLHAGAQPTQKVNAVVQFEVYDGQQVLAGQFPILMPATAIELAAEFDKVSNACEPADIVSVITSPGWPNAGPRVLELLYTSVNRKVVVVFI